MSPHCHWLDKGVVDGSNSTPISGGSRIFPRRGRQLSGGAPGYDFIKISQKLNEIKEISAPGGCASPAPPLDPPLPVADPGFS